MKSKRSFVALIANKKHIYAIGGQLENETLACVECYDVDADVWIEVEAMSIQRAAAAVAVSKHYIYVVGGSTQCNSMETATVERMHLVTEKWTKVKETSQKKRKSYLIRASS